jgi:hypothetical protein
VGFLEAQLTRLRQAGTGAGAENAPSVQEEDEAVLWAVLRLLVDTQGAVHSQHGADLESSPESRAVRMLLGAQGAESLPFSLRSQQPVPSWGDEAGEAQPSSQVLAEIEVSLVRSVVGV